VDVDMETGFVKCKDMIIAHDCGKPLNPVNVEAQSQGAAIQGMGQALYEQFVMDHGRTLNANLADYKMPLSLDVPHIDVIDIITDDPHGPYGAKEASEGAIVSAPPSIISAIHDATGIWFKEQPVTPEKIAMALKDKKK
jgi:CO/xanthine dehydrogenase Mo-binding subunit